MLEGFGVDDARSDEPDSRTYLRSDPVVASTWSDTVRINLEKTGSTSDSVIQAKQVDKSDSSGIAFIIELLRLAHTYHKEVIFHQVPEQMLAIAKLSSVDELFVCR